MTAMQELDALVIRIGEQSALRLMLDSLLRVRAERDSLRSQLASAHETIEDIAIGRRMECVKCGKPRPCICQDNGS